MAANTNDERVAILKMIEEDKITAEQGLRLLEALNSPAASKATSIQAAPRAETLEKNGRFFRVVVTNTQTGKIKAHVTLPMSLVSWGLRIGAHFSPEMEGINMEELGEILQNTEHGKIVDVMDEEDGEHVEIFID
jgi:hypothetical protein